MEDDGTVNYSKEPTSGSSSSSSSSTAPPSPQSSSPSSPIRGTREGFNSDSSKPTNEVSTTSSKESGGNYGSLKELTTSIKRPTWTKLDFKGGSVEDTSRTKGMNKAASVDDVNTKEGGSIGGGNLQDLLPKRATWTKLDFKGGSGKSAFVLCYYVYVCVQYEVL